MNVAINFYLLSPSVSPFSLKEARGEFWEGGATVPHIACIASVWVWFRSKERPRSNEGGMGFLVLATRKMEQKPKYKTGGRERGRTLPPPRSFTHPILRVVFDSRSLFLAQKLHQNACYAGYPPYKLFFLFKQGNHTCFFPSI